MKEQWHTIIHTKRFRVAWHSLKDWRNGGWFVQSWFFSFRLRSGYVSKTNTWGNWWQLCILGLNIGYLYKID